MKRFLQLLTVTSLISSLLISMSVGAQEMVLQAGEGGVVAAVRNRCQEIQEKLRQVHTNDALFRVNAGQTYNIISSQLMARLNSRLALSRIDSTAFVEASGRLDSYRADFAKKHTAYDIDISELIGVDCKSKPAEFYASLVKVRESRKQVGQTIQLMNDAVRDYQLATEALRGRLAGNPSGGSAQ